MMKKIGKKKIGILVSIIAILLVIVIVVIDISTLSTKDCASIAYQVLYADDLKPTPTPEEYIDDPCECVFVSGGNSNNNSITSNTNTNTNTSGSNANAGSLTGSSNEEKAWNYLCAYFEDEMIVAAIVGNLKQESNFDPKADHAGLHRGIAQWDTTDRYPKMKNWCDSNGLDCTSFDAQIKYLVHEMTGQYKGILGMYKKVLKNNTYKAELEGTTKEYTCKTYEQKIKVLAKVVARHYEVCINSDGSLQNITERMQYSIDVYKKYNSCGISNLSNKVAYNDIITSYNGSIIANASKKNKTGTTGQTGGTGGAFKAPTYTRNSDSTNKKLLNTVKHILPGAVACQEYYGLSAISALAQARKEHFTNASSKDSAKKDNYHVYGLRMKNIFTKKTSESGSWCGYENYNEAVVGRCYNFVSSGYYDDVVKAAKDKKNYKKQIYEISYSPYCSSESHEEYYDDFLHNAYSFINGGSWTDTTMKYNYDDIAYAKKCIVAWGLESEYADAINWIKKYEKHKNTYGKAPEGFGELDGQAVSSTSSNSESSVDIADVKTAQSLLNFKDSNLDKKISKFTFEADTTKCEKVNFKVYMPKNGDRYVLELANNASTFNRSALCGVVVHHTLGGAEGLNNNGGVFFNSWNNNGGLGSHFGISEDGTIYQYLPINKVSAAQNDENSTYLSIEVGDEHKPYKYSKKTYKALIHLVAYLCVELKVDITCKFVKNKKDNLYWDYGSGLIRHYDCKKSGSFRGKACPSYWSPHDDSVEDNNCGIAGCNHIITSTGGNMRWIAFKADVYRYIANHKNDSNFKISGILGLDEAKKLADGHKNEFDWSTVDSLMSNVDSVESSGKNMWICDCEIPCPKCHCHDNETEDMVQKGIGNEANNGSSGSNNNTDGGTGTDEISNVAKAVVKGHCEYITKNNIGYDGSSNYGRYAQKEYSSMTINGNNYTGFRRDCTGLMTAIFVVLGDYSASSPIFNSSTLQGSNAELEKNWTKHKITNKYIPMTGDVLVKSGHAEMFYSLSGGTMKVWNWGSENNYESYKGNGYKPINSGKTPQSYTYYWRRNTVK